MKKLTCYILSFIFVFLVIILSCERKRFDNPYDPKNRPGPPQLLSPQDGEVCDLNPPFFEWEKENGSTIYAYNLQIDSSANFPDTSYPFSFVVYDTSTLSYYELMDFGYFTDKSYYCRLRYGTLLNPPAWSKWSDVRSFRVKIPLVASCSLNFPPSSYPYSTQTDGDTAYFSTYEGEIQVFSLYPPEELTSFLSGYEKFRILGVEDKLMYGYYYSYADSYYVSIFDINDLNNPQKVLDLKFDYISSFSKCLSFDNNRLAFLKRISYGDTVYNDTTFLFDISNYPQIDSSIFTPEFQCIYIEIFGDAAYIITEEKDSYKIHIMDISDIMNPQETYRLKFYNYITFLASNDNFVYIKENNSDIYVYEISNPLIPIYVGNLDISGSFKEISNDYMLTQKYINGYYHCTLYQLDQGFPSNELGGIFELDFTCYYMLGSKYLGINRRYYEEMDVFRIFYDE